MIGTEAEGVAKIVLAFGLLLAALTIAVLPAAKHAHASTTFTVNSTGDDGDQSPGNGSCSTGSFIAGAGLECTLRAAVQEANATTGSDTIGFNIPGSGVKTIKPDSPLPDITEAVTIDGYTQSGASPNTLSKGTDAKLMIELDGENVVQGSALLDGLRIHASDGVIRGLVINRFSGNAISISSPSLQAIVSGNRVEGNFIGTDPTGTQDLGSRFGVSIDHSADNTVGGATPEARNLISGNDLDGVVVGGGSDATGNEVIGNLIGTDASGTGALGNSRHGVSGSALDNAIGGTEPGSGNTIAFNGEDGVVIEALNGESILRNSIFSNGSLGIDLADDGPTANDFVDLDDGPNDLQNFPVLTRAATRHRSTTIAGKLNSTPGQRFTIQFFSNPKGANGGKTFLGEKSVTTNARGDASFSFRARRAAGVITATATNQEGSTSEFSKPRLVRRA